MNHFYFQKENLNVLFSNLISLKSKSDRQFKDNKQTNQNYYYNITKKY